MEYEMAKPVNWYVHECISCHTLFAIPVIVNNQLRASHQSFRCPFGHSQFYPEKNDTEKWKEYAETVSNRLEHCKSDKKELFNEMEFFRDKIKQLKKENKGLKIVKSRYKNQLKNKS